ncbi:hypothetical protein E2C01_016619 [Portunus trituberculatus]|uniref:Secreted protein n=1 Tax=Portunus trituberculatus TaxID=210409 RepID=A0A5B7DRF4_PORTR|nr:hypothetical protein [Portunus trituberculatus]
MVAVSCLHVVVVAAAAGAGQKTTRSAEDPETDPASCREHATTSPAACGLWSASDTSSAYSVSTWMVKA